MRKKLPLTLRKVKLLQTGQTRFFTPMGKEVVALRVEADSSAVEVEVEAVEVEVEADIFLRTK